VFGGPESFEWLDQFLWSSRTVAFARLSTTGSVKQANDRFSNLFLGGLQDRRLQDLVIQGQRDQMVQLLRHREPCDAARLFSFSEADQTPTTLLVSWRWEGDELLVLGEAPVVDLETSQMVLVKLNSRVSELLRENTKKSAQLEKAIGDLREAQVMLVHREKMAALGQMTAGVAHELNNPLAYVKNNQYLLRRGLEDLLGLVNLLRENIEDFEQTRPDLVDAVLERMESIDLPHLSESMPRLLASLDNGVDRAAGLVKQLRTFSRLDEGDVKTVDLNASVRSVVEFAGLQMKENDTEFAAEYGDLPLVMCAAGQVNQALLNILQNAIQAAGKGGKVTLATETDRDFAVIKIWDSGPGVPSDLFQRIFEPFFTTKPVGGGTGLGLSIAHSVIADHGGTIELVSPPGEGATFVVRLPLACNQPTESDP
jgi:two-component system, NtrC family, sensor kinase